MKQLKIMEWKKLYPIKKIVLMVVWLFMTFLWVAGIVVFFRNHGIDNLLIGIVFGIGAIASFCPIKRYIFTTYHCVPCLNSILTKDELEELLEGETFVSISDQDHRIDKCPLSLSENWISAKGRLFAKNLLIAAYPEVTSSLIGRATTPMVFMYMTGDVINVDLEINLSAEQRRLLKQYLLHDLEIVSKELAPKQVEEISNIVKEQYQFLKEETKLDDKGLIREILQDSDKFKHMYMEKLPFYIKKWCKEHVNEE